MSIMAILEKFAKDTLEPVQWVERRPKCDRCREYEVMNYGDICEHCQTEKAQGYQVMSLGGRAWNGAERDHGTLYHAVTNYTARCGTKPGRRSIGWTREIKPVTCPRCIKKLTKSPHTG